MSNPIGLAAGYDKHAEAIDSMLGLGFGYVEVGSITPNPQLGNPKPRFFRLEKDEAVINRYGFNSQGHGAALVKLQKRLDSYMKTFGTPSTYSLKQGTMLGVNLGKNKYSPESSHQDYLDGIETLGPYADIIVINISSPNTPGLRSLQHREPIKELLTLAKQKRDKCCPRPLVVKIAPDCDDMQLSDIASVVQEVGIDGIIIGNTTISRNGLKSGNYNLVDPELVNQVGGLSGKPLKPLALAAVSKFYNLTKGKVPIIGCGGISNAQDCLDFCEAGATIVQIYTEFGYKGPSLIPDIKQELAELLEKRGKTWMETIGSKQ